MWTFSLKDWYQNENSRLLKVSVYNNCSTYNIRLNARPGGLSGEQDTGNIINIIEAFNIRTGNLHIIVILTVTY